MTPDRPVHDQLLAQIRGHQLAALIHLAVRWDLPDRIGERRGLADLAHELQVDFASLRRMVRALAASGIFSVDEQNVATQTPASRLLMRDVPSSLHAAASFWGMSAAWRAWADLEYAIRTGDSVFEHLFQRPLFDYLDEHPGHLENFNRFMQRSPEERHAAVVQAGDFARFQRVADIGGGNGQLLATILAAAPSVHGILHDRASVVGQPVHALRAMAWAGRCDIVCGDFFEAVPRGADAYVLSQILHDWDDSNALRILGRCREAAEAGTTLLVIERLLDLGADGARANDFLSDIEMLVLHRSGERSTQEYRSLLDEAGFRVERVIATTSPFSLIECQAV